MASLHLRELNQLTHVGSYNSREEAAYAQIEM